MDRTKDGSLTPLIQDAHPPPPLNQEDPTQLSHRDTQSVQSNRQIDPLPTQLYLALDRVRLMPHACPKRMPFNHYKSIVPTYAQLNPYHFIQQHLGISETTFEAHISQVIDDLLIEINLTKKQILPPPQTNPPSFEQAMSKMDCLCMFRDTSVPTTGPHLGVYRWAIELRMARFNVDMDFDPQSLTILDVYN